MSHEFPPSEDPAALAAAAAPPAPAGFWVRAGAWIIDSMILSFAILFPIQGLAALAGLAYKTIFHAQGGQTPGKMAAGIKVVAEDGSPLGWGRSTGRTAASILSGLLCGLGYLPAAFGEKRALHDRLAGTKVVRAEDLSTGRQVLFGGLAALGVLGVAVFLAIGVIAAGAGGGKFSELLKRAGEGATKGNLGALRAATAIYYGDTDGSYPATLEGMIGPKWIDGIPAAKTGDHPETRAWTAYGDEVCEPMPDPKNGKLGGARLRDTGGWGYVADPKSNCWGMVFVDCTHRDQKGKPWFEY